MKTYTVPPCESCGGRKYCMKSPPPRFGFRLTRMKCETGAKGWMTKQKALKIVLDFAESWIIGHGQKGEADKELKLAIEKLRGKKHGTQTTDNSKAGKPGEQKTVHGGC